MGLLQRSHTTKRRQSQRLKTTAIGHDEIRARIEQIPIFSEVVNDSEAVRKIVEIVDTIEVPKNTRIIEEGSVGTEMYILHSGEVEIQKFTRAGDQYTVAKLHAALNVFFGELALIDNDRRSASVTALSDSILITITKRNFDMLGLRAPEIVLPITRSIARILSKRLRKTTNDMLTIFDALVQELSE